MLKRVMFFFLLLANEYIKLVDLRGCSVPVERVNYVLKTCATFHFHKSQTWNLPETTEKTVPGGWTEHVIAFTVAEGCLLMLWNGHQKAGMPVLFQQGFHWNVRGVYTKTLVTLFCNCEAENNPAETHNFENFKRKHLVNPDNCSDSHDRRFWTDLINHRKLTDYVTNIFIHASAKEASEICHGIHVGKRHSGRFKSRNKFKITTVIKETNGLYSATSTMHHVEVECNPRHLPVKLVKPS
ncbi:uncharacterized protein LOC122809477 [Protopterus annectens]|uniref:uncharacterized protein LOC122809477 n=1 Tax=Protopterus annectens TaxID=7888 RepID=UPI001CFA9765|nr:uncharacterized protein LOC122809477 [Protopterus annectens]XP_043936954.1 uncharacterized protein LOC122809477 [Protopterus annectens]